MLQRRKIIWRKTLPIWGVVVLLALSGCVTGSRSFSGMDATDLRETITVQETTRGDLRERLGPPQSEGIHEGLLTYYWRYQKMNPLIFLDQRGCLMVQFDENDVVVEYDYIRRN